MGLNAMGYEKTTPIQRESDPCDLDNKDLIAVLNRNGKTASLPSYLYE